MKALILAGGKGTRLRPYTTAIPKPLMPVGNMPILELLLIQLKHYGISEVYLAIGYLGHLIKAHFENRSDLGMAIKYYEEDKPLGTAGPISNVIDELSDDFLLLNGDLLTTLNFRNLINAHEKQSSGITIGAYVREVNIDFGVLETDNNCNLQGWNEKPTHTYDVSMGIYVLKKGVAKAFLKEGEYQDIPDLILDAQKSGETVYCFKDDCYWLDIGRPSDYDEANRIIESDPDRFLPKSNI